MGLLCSKREKKLDLLESSSQNGGLTEGNACGHCGEASAKLTELIAELDLVIRPNSVDRLAGKPHDDSG